MLVSPVEQVITSVNLTSDNYCCLHFDTGINKYTLNRPEQFNFQQDMPTKKHKNVNIFDISKFSDAQTFISRKFFHNFFFSGCCANLQWMKVKTTQVREVL